MGLSDAQEVTREAIDAESTGLGAVGAVTRLDAELEGQVVTVTHLD